MKHKEVIIAMANDEAEQWRDAFIELTGGEV